MNAIEVRNLNVKRGSFALKNISMEIPKGCVVGLVGRNGAGKSTLIETLAGVLGADSGMITYSGVPVWENETEIKKELGVVFDGPWFNDMVRPKQLIEGIYPWYPEFDLKYFEAHMKKMGIDPNMSIDKYSSGMLKKFLLLFVLARKPKTLILDEPTSGVDPISRNEMLDLLYEFMQEEDHSLLFSTHVTSDLDKIADYVVMMEDGRIVLNEAKDELRNRYRTEGEVLPDIETIMLDVAGIQKEQEM